MDGSTSPNVPGRHIQDAHVTPPQPEPGSLRLSYFRTTKQNSPGLMQFATHKTATPPLAGELIAQQTTIYRAMHFMI